MEMDKDIQPVATAPNPANGENAGPPPPHPAFLKFLDCDLVFNELVRYLSFKDIKVLSILSKRTLVAVRKSQEFSKRFRLRINDRFQSPELDEALQNSGCPYLWKSVSFDPRLPKRVDELIQDKLEFVESLHLCEKYKGRRSNTLLNRLEFILPGASPTPPISRPTMHDLWRTRNLRELEFDEMRLAFHLGRKLRDVKKQEVLKGLEKLTFRTYYSPELCTELRHILDALSRMPLKLTKLAIDIINCGTEVELDSIPKVVAACKDTLEELGLPELAWKFEGMKLIRCPKLKRLTFSVLSEDVECAKAFFQSQPLVEELKVKYYGASSVEEVLNCFRGKLAKVRKFQVVTPMAEGVFYPRSVQQPVNYSLLAGMPNLREFNLEAPPPIDFESGPKLLTALPSKLKSLTLNSGQESVGTELGIDLDWFGRCRTSIGTHLKRFGDLTHLDLTQCSDRLNDDDMQTIIKSCPKLMDLAFGNSLHLTDFGISGVRQGNEEGGGEQGVALSDLRGLVALSIKCCDELTPEGVANVVRFQFLRSFVYLTDVEWKRRIENKDEFLRQIRRQSPRLDFLRILVMPYVWEWSNDLEGDRWEVCHEY